MIFTQFISRFRTFKALSFVALLVAGLTFSGDVVSQIAFAPGPQITSFNGPVRGYHFIAPANFNICEVFVPNTMNNNMWHVEIVKFTTAAPPAFPGTTNAFTSMFYADSVTSTTAITCNVPVATGDIIGIYGSRSISNTNANTMANSYDSPNFVTTILGNNVTLRRSGMQFPLNNQQMHDIWSEINFNCARIIGFHSCCPTPATPGPITGPGSACQGNTIALSIPSMGATATNYTWSVNSNGNDSILTGQGTTAITVQVSAISLGDTICVNWTDSCTNSLDTCFVYTINQPAVPGLVTGDSVVCGGNVSTYSLPAVAGAINYAWTAPTGAAITSGQGTNSISVTWGNTSGNICVVVTDNCAPSVPVCLAVTVNSAPSPANAGPDQTLCSGLTTQLQGNNPTSGTGTWSLISGSGSVGAATLYNSTFSNVATGANTLVWTISTGTACPPTSDVVVITAAQSPDAEFSLQNVCDGLPSSFQDQSIANGGLSLTSWNWDIDGDGFADYTQQNPGHVFNNSGTFPVRLIVANTAGCTDTAIHDAVIHPVPVPGFSQVDVCDELPMSFVDNTTVLTGNITTWTWDFGDASSVSNLQSPDHTYLSPGIYSVNLSVVTDSGCTNSITIPSEVFHNPVVTFNAPNKCQNNTVNYSENSTVPGSNVVDWVWDYGDGSLLGTTKSTSHDYTLPGDYQVLLSVTTEDGCVGTLEKTLTVHPVPEPEFNFDNKVCLGDDMQFTDVTSIASGSVDTWEWRFIEGSELGDTSYSTVQNPVIGFLKHGTHSVKFTAISADFGCEHTITKTINVFPSPVASFITEEVCQGNEQRFLDDSFMEDGTIGTWEWDFNEGNPTIGQRLPYYTFGGNGTFNVSLKVTATNGCSDFFTKPVVVHEQPVADFSFTQVDSCSPLEISFVNSSSIQSGASLSYEWQFGDDSTSNKLTPSHIYRNVSTSYQQLWAKLIVTSSQGNCTAEKIAEDSIHVDPEPIAGFSANPLSPTVLEPLVRFNDLTFGANYWAWDFGDGSVSDSPIPSHAYELAGTYTVRQVVTNVFGCEDVYISDVTVQPQTTLYFPLAFTPNGDGKNDSFFGMGLDVGTEYVMRIYDRWGNMIFRGVGMDSQWDGRTSGGEIAPIGVYVYKVTYKDLQGKKQDIYGNFSLIGVR